MRGGDGPGEFPTVNFIGNKEKIAPWILDRLGDGGTLADVFSGGSSVGFEAKRRGFAVRSNDIMRVNYLIAKALVENRSVTLDGGDVDAIFSGAPRKGFMYRNYSRRAFYPRECMELDGYRRKILGLPSPYKRALAFALMRRSMIRKMPYSRFTIPWGKVVQLRDEEYSYRMYGRGRGYHNMSFRDHFEADLDAYNDAVFDNGEDCRAHNSDVFMFLSRGRGDVAYIDPPYMGSMSDYHGFYGAVDDYVLSRRTGPFRNDFGRRSSIVSMLERLFRALGGYRVWALSYNNNSFPPRSVILSLLGRHRGSVSVFRRRHNYQVSGSAMKSRNVEYLFVLERGRR
ncbi:MAG: DNA adenine methylase [Nitrosopumilus sp.]|nr:DNA adenine methylase [Nitrosopumilus sp.]